MNADSYGDALDCTLKEITKLREQVAAQAAVIEKLRDALSNCLVEHPDKPFVHLAAWRVKEALAIPTDSTQILAEVRRAERERCAKVCEAFSEDDDAMDRQVKAQCAKLILAME